jgi:Yip1 domain
MPNSTIAAGTSSAPMNVFARFIGIITAPKATFQSVVANPKILGMLTLTTAIIAFGAALPMTTEAGKQAALDQQVAQLESFGMQVGDEQYENMRKGMRIAPYTTAISIAVVSPIVVAILAGILFAIFNAAMGGEASYKQVYAVLVHAGVISALGQLFVGPFNYFRGSTSNPTTFGALLPMFDDASFTGKFLGMMDLFVIWWVVVLAIGLAVLYRRKTQPIAITMFGIYALIAVGFAAFMSRS